MRWIKKREEPAALRNWRAKSQADPGGTGINYGYDVLRQNQAVSDEILRTLINEQGGLCAYTGVRITPATCHVEHLKPQSYCERGEDVAYTNMVACWPWPNCGFKAAFGAHAKGDWPDAKERHRFVTPLEPSCEERFQFDRLGEIKPAQPNDTAAATTIAKLNLDEQSLNGRRREAIVGVLGKCQQLTLKDARRRLAAMKQREKELNEGTNVTLAPFCFAVRQALVKHINKIESIIRMQRS